MVVIAATGIAPPGPPSHANPRPSTLFTFATCPHRHAFLPLLSAKYSISLSGSFSLVFFFCLCSSLLRLLSFFFQVFSFTSLSFSLSLYCVSVFSLFLFRFSPPPSPLVSSSAMLTHALTHPRAHVRPFFFALLFSHFFPLSPSHDGRHVRLVVFVVLRAFLPPPFFAVALIVSFWSRSLVLSLFRLLFHTLSLSFSLPLCCGKEKEDGVETCPAGQPESAEEQEKSPRSMRRRTWLTNKTTKATGSRNLRDGVRNERHMRSGGSL